MRRVEQQRARRVSQEPAPQPRVPAPEPARRPVRAGSKPERGNPRATQKLDQPVSSFLVP